MTPDIKKGLFLSAVAMTFAGAFVIPWKIATQHGSSALMVLLLVTVAATSNTAIMVAQGGLKSLIRKPSKLELFLGVLFAVVTLLGNWASAEAIIFLSPAIVSVLMRSEVIIVAVLAAMLLKEPTGKVFWIGITVVGIGFWIMQPSAELGNQWYIGAGFSILSALAFAIMAVLTRKFIHDVDIVLVNSIRLWLSVLLWFPFNNGIPSLEELNPSLVLYVSIAAIIGPSLGRLLFMKSAKYLEARISALMICGAPIVTLVLGILLLKEFPESNELLGGFCMLIGILSILWRGVGGTPKKGLKSLLGLFCSSSRWETP